MRVVPACKLKESVLHFWRKLFVDTLRFTFAKKCSNQKGVSAISVQLVVASAPTAATKNSNSNGGGIGSSASRIGCGIRGSGGRSSSQNGGGCRKYVRIFVCLSTPPILSNISVVPLLYLISSIKSILWILSIQSPADLAVCQSIRLLACQFRFLTVYLSVSIVSRSKSYHPISLYLHAYLTLLYLPLCICLCLTTYTSISPSSNLPTFLYPWIVHPVYWLINWF